MNKYNLGNKVCFNYGEELLEGEIIGIVKDNNNNYSYCIFNPDLPGVYPIEEDSFPLFETYSHVLTTNIGKLAYWKDECNIHSVVKIIKSGVHCSKCKEFNKYIQAAEYTCWYCTNYPY
jgi:hypothetical protein